MPIKQSALTNLDVAEEQVLYWRTHLDVFLKQCFPPFNPTRNQHLMLRAIGNNKEINIVCSRGYGKSYIAAWAAFGIGVLYPGSTILIMSATAKQATIILGKLKMIADQNANVANEIKSSSSKSLVKVSKDTSECELKNGSKIVSGALDSLRGQRAKFIICDECLDVDQESFEAIAAPIRNATRDISLTYGFKDFESKMLCITSACEKGNAFYSRFMQTLRQMANRVPGYCCMCFDYISAARNGITSMEFFEGEKLRMPKQVFDMEYGSIFIGNAQGAAFPYELIDKCRTLNSVELEQPKNSKSRYIISLDIATSEAKNADNSIISVVKFTEKASGCFSKKLVYMRSFHGKSLDILANEIRRLYHTKFPNAEKIIYDARGLGDSLDRFFDNEYVDEVSGKEYPPLVTDEEFSPNSSAMQVLHPFRAVVQLNQRLYSNLRVCLEQNTLEIPISSRTLQAQSDSDVSASELAVFLEADALHFEMGNIVAKVGASGNVLYDVPHANMHKDRYSSLAMAIDYICEIEKENVKKMNRSSFCVGIATNF